MVTQVLIPVFLYRVDEIFAIIGEENPEPAYMAKRRREVLLQ